MKKTIINIEDKKKQFLKNLMYLRAKDNNLYLLEKIKNKEKIRVVFVVYLVSMWKLDNVVKLMQEDEHFEVVIFISPCQVYSQEKKWKEFKDAIDFFSKRGLQVISSWNEKEQKFISFDQLNADLVFFSNPWDYSNGLYYSNIYEKYLCCYIKYGIGTAHERDYQQYDMPFHINMWQIYSSDEFDYDTNKNFTTSHGENVFLTGAPYLEDLIAEKKISDPWKNKDKRKRVIFAPHHTIEVDRRYNYRLSNFLDVAEHIKKVATEYQDKVVWCFKPHPHLRENLYRHPLWGKEKTENYYDFWKKNEYTQLSEGEYVGFFKYSDAMMHDSSSFLVEYLSVKKPVLYFVSEHTNSSLNKLGLSALSSCMRARNKKEISLFIDNLVNNNVRISKKHIEFYRKNIYPFHSSTSPSEKIVNLIKKELLSI